MKQHFSLNSFVAGVIVGALLFGAWFFGSTSSLSPGSSFLNTTASTKDETPESSAVAVSNQPAGSEVLVSSVTVPSPGVWIAVREVAGNDDLGNVLGAARVSGSHAEVSIPLLRATQPGRTYAVELYRDDNDGVFDPGLNSVYVDFDTGARVVVHFTTTE